LKQRKNLTEVDKAAILTNQTVIDINDEKNDYTKKNFMVEQMIE
jgi:hypothetical protein